MSDANRCVVAPRGSFGFLAYGYDPHEPLQLEDHGYEYDTSPAPVHPALIGSNGAPTTVMAIGLVENQYVTDAVCR